MKYSPAHDGLSYYIQCPACGGKHRFADQIPPTGWIDCPGTGCSFVLSGPYLVFSLACPHSMAGRQTFVGVLPD